ncbi:MAG: hypothetical protein QMD23_04905 [Candidatus Bathyarchaeia archaeon]|nr:hypothetical protein [Candidatus Bathyarchaeia archaeon]
MAGVKEYGADPELKRLYLVYLGIVLLGGFLWWMVPVVVFVVFSLETWIGVVVALSSLFRFLLLLESRYIGSLSFILR